MELTVDNAYVRSDEPYKYHLNGRVISKRRILRAEREQYFQEHPVSEIKVEVTVNEKFKGSTKNIKFLENSKSIDRWFTNKCDKYSLTLSQRRALYNRYANSSFMHETDTYPSISNKDSIVIFTYKERKFLFIEPIISVEINY